MKSLRREKKGRKELSADKYQRFTIKEDRLRRIKIRKEGSMMGKEGVRLLSRSVKK